MSFFLPKQPRFFLLFKNLTGQIEEIADLLLELTQTFKKRSGFLKKAREIEARADKTAHEIVETLNRSFITPFDREDVHLLVSRLDDVVDLIEDVVRNLDVYRVEENKPALGGFARLIQKSAGSLSDLVAELEKEKMTKKLQELRITIHELEDEGDRLFEKALRTLFREKKDPLVVLKWKDIYEGLEQVLDTFQSASDTIEGIAIKVG